MKCTHTTGRRFRTLLKILRLCEYDVARQFPRIARVRFEQVNDVERRPILVPIVEFIERGNLPAKRRSSIAAENQHDWRFPAEVGKLDGLGTIRGIEPEIGRGISYAQAA